MKLKKTFVTFAILIALSAMIYSCKDDTTADRKSDKETEATTSEKSDNMEQSDYKESPKDLVSVNYETFYRELSTGGEWVQVKAKDIGVDLSSSSFDKKGNDLLGKLLGVKTAYAQDDDSFDTDMVFVWKPLADLGVALNIGDDTPNGPVSASTYVPYTNGRWIYTDDAGWYFLGATPQEEITSHYGRWVYDNDMGYVWVPGRVWSPAWVDWRIDDSNIAWAPIPPGEFIDNNVIIIDDNDIDDDDYVVMEKRYFTDEKPSKYMYMYKENPNGKVMIKEMRKGEGVVIRDGRIMNIGPDVKEIEAATGRPVIIYDIQQTDQAGASGVTGNKIMVKRHNFQTISTQDRAKGPKPNKVVTKEEAKQIKAREKEMRKDMKENEKEMKKDEKEMRKDEKEMRKDTDMNNKNKGNDNDKGNKKNDDQDKGRLKGPVGNDKDKDNDSKGKGNDKGNNKDKR